MPDENWKVTEQLTQPMVIDRMLVCTVLYSHRERADLHAWLVLDARGHQGWSEFEHPDEGSLEERLVRRLRALEEAIEDWRKVTK